MNAPTDEQLLAEYIEGKDSSFELLVRRHTQELYQFVMRFTGASGAADDVVQETFLQVHRSGTQFDPKRRFKPWLFTIGANKARDHLRRIGRRREVPLDAQVSGTDDAGQRFVDLLAGVDVLPEEDLAVDEKRRLVRGLLESMPPKLREVLVLAYYHRFPYRDIADIVGVPLGTVKSRLHGAVTNFGRRYRQAIVSQEKREP